MVDILIPIYNAYDDLLRCIESVKKHTDFSEARMILVNDCSSDERIAPYIDSLASHHVLIHHNVTNKGFSANVNYGFSCSEENDVLLLNTDTVVTEGWLQKLRACAYRDPVIGTVTPLSNSATICSVPEFCKDNPLPDGYTVDSFGRLIEKYSLKRYPEISVAVGFCMYIKREVIDTVGLFDAETFQRGYGEENDFCNRAKIAGYRHVVCDDTFVYHSGTASFVPEEKMALIQAHEKILYERYPELMAANRVFYTTNPLADIQMNIRMRMALDNDRKNILFLSQRDFREDAADHIGGTQLHVKDMKDGLVDRFNVFVMARDGAFMRLTIYAGKQTVSMKFRIGKPTEIPSFFIEEHRKLYDAVLDTFEIQLVHIHHTYQLSLDLFYAARERNIPLVCTLHDFYYVCPSIKLLDDTGKCCAETCDLKHCASCFHKTNEISFSVPKSIDYIRLWRKRNAEALALCDELVTPSENAKTIFSRFFPELKEKIHPIPHGVDMGLTKEPLVKMPERWEMALQGVIEKVPSRDDMAIGGWCFVPNADANKVSVYICVKVNEDTYYYEAPRHPRPDVAEAFGSQYLESGVWAMIPQYLLQDDMDVSFAAVYEDTLYCNEQHIHVEHLISLDPAPFTVAFVGGLSAAKGGRTALEMVENGPKSFNWIVLGGTDVRELKFKDQRNYLYSHWYKREELPQLLRRLKVDLVCILPIWPETYCYVLTEAIASGVPVLVTDLGAPGERTRKNDYGWVVPAGSGSREILKKIQWIWDHKEEYDRVKSKAQEMTIRTVSDMAADYDTMYRKLFREPTFGAPDMPMMVKGQQLEEHNLPEDANTMQQLMLVEQELNQIKGGAAYKFAMALNGWNIPFKHKIKAFAFKLLRLFGLKI